MQTHSLYTVERVLWLCLEGKFNQPNHVATVFPCLIKAPLIINQGHLYYLEVSCYTVGIEISTSLNCLCLLSK